MTHIDGRDRFRLNTIDHDFAVATAEAILDVTGVPARINGPYQDKRYPKSAPQYMLVSYDQAMCQLLRVQTDSKTQIPGWIFDSPKDDRLAFIAGLMDSEGFVAEQRDRVTDRRYFMGFKSCDKWVPEFVRLLEITGIRIGGLRQEVPRKPGYKAPLKFNIKMQSWVDAGGYFRCSRKQRRVDTWLSCEPYSQRRRYPRKVAKAILNEHTPGAQTTA